MKKHRVKGYESLDMTKTSDAYGLVDDKYSSSKVDRPKKVLGEPFSVSISKVSVARSQLKPDGKENRDEGQVKLLKSIKNKYYLRREHLNPAGSSGLAKESKAAVKRCSPEKIVAQQEPGVPSLLPARRLDRNYTLVLDLDETLVHFVTAEKKFKLRPGCLWFVREMSRIFEVVVFTAAAKDYADFILDVIERRASNLESEQ